MISSIGDFLLVSCIHLAVWLPTTAAAPTAFSVARPRAAPAWRVPVRVLRSVGSSLVAVAMADDGGKGYAGLG